MLRSLKPLRQYIILASDGSIGRVHDFYFNDDSWKVRYLVAKTGSWLTGRKVLISTSSLGKADWGAHTFAVALTRKQIRHSPSINTDEPVSRQQEIKLHEHYGWPHYWIESPLAVSPPLTQTASDAAMSKPATRGKGNPHLRSVHEVTGYRVHASDGDLGRVKDFIVNDADWIIRYLVIDLSVWMPTKKVLLSPPWLGGINFRQRRVTVNISQESVLNCPEFHPTAAVNRAYEEKLYDYYGRPVYWAEGTRQK